MIDLEIYTNKIAESGRRIIRKAYKEARSHDHKQVTPEHVLLAIAEVERSFFNEVMQNNNLDPLIVIHALETKLSQRNYMRLGKKKLGNSLRALLANSLKHAHKREQRNIESTDFFVSVFKDRRSFPLELINRLGLDPERLRAAIMRELLYTGEFEKEELAPS